MGRVVPPLVRVAMQNESAVATVVPPVRKVMTVCCAKSDMSRLQTERPGG